MAGSLGTVFGQVRLDVKQAVAAYAALRAQNARTVYAMRGAGQAFQTAGRTMTAAGVGLLYIFGKAVTAAAEFERRMDFFGAVSDTTGEKLKAVGDNALEVSRKTIFSANEIADGYIELGKAGVSAEQILNGVGEAMANLGAAGDIPLAESGQIITSTIQQFSLKAKDATNVADELAGAANASIADISDLGVSLKYVGGVAHTAGLGFEDTLTAISLLAKAGIRGSTAGTSLRQMIVSFGGATEPATEALKKLGIITEDGSNKFYDAAGNLKPLSQVFEILGNATEDLTAKQRVQTMRTIFNNRALSAAAILSKEGAKGFAQMNKAMSQTTAAEVAHARLDNLSGDLEILRGNLETTFIQAGTPFQEFLRGVVQGITKLVQAFSDLPASTQKTIFTIIGVGGAVLTLMGILSMIIGQLLLFGAFFSRFGAGFSFFGRILGTVIGGVSRFLGITQALRAVFGPLFSIIGRFGGVILRLVLGFSRLGVIGWVIRGVMIAIGAVIGTISAPVLIVIAVIAALVAAFVILWNKCEPFKQFWVDLWGKIVQAAVAAWGWLQSLPGKFSSMWSSITSAVGNFVSGVVNWFQQLPGRVSAFVSQMVTRVVGFFKSLPGKVGYAIGFLIGRTIRMFIQMGVAVGHAVGTMVTNVVQFFQQLPGRIIGFLASMVARAISFGQRLRTGLVNAATATVNGVVNFFRNLPSNLANLMQNAAAMAINAASRLKSGVVNMASAAVSGMVNFFSSLPGRIISFFSSMASGAINAMNGLVSAAANVGTSIYNGISNAISSLPSLVGGVISSIVSAFTNAAANAAAAVRDFAGGVVQGFKDGLGIGSPSYLERAMWAIRDNVVKTTKDLAKTTLGVQKMSKQMGGTNVLFPGVVQQYASLARLNRAADARREYMSTTRARGSAPVQHVSKKTDIHMDIKNPAPEKPSDTAVRRLNRVAQLGLLDGGRDD